MSEITNKTFEDEFKRVAEKHNLKINYEERISGGKIELTIEMFNPKVKVRSTVVSDLGNLNDIAFIFSVRESNQLKMKSYKRKFAFDHLEGWITKIMSEVSLEEIFGEY